MECSPAPAKPCEECVGRAPLPALIHGCYRDSRVATVGMTMGTTLHRARRTYQTKVDRFVVLTYFAARRFIAHGVPAERISVRGNCLASDPGVGEGDGGLPRDPLVASRRRKAWAR